MKCFELHKCSKEEREQCFVYRSYPDKTDLDGVKCWIMNGAFQKGNDSQLEKCLNCPYYKDLNKDSGISQLERTNATVISVTGTINNDRSKSLEDVLGVLLDKKRYYTVLDLTNVNNIYSCGLGTIIRMHKEMVSRGGAFFVVNPQPYIMSIFESTKLTRFLSIFEKEQEAITAIEEKIRGREQKKEQKKISEETAKELEKKKTQKCWEYWNNHNPKNANTCDECYRKNTDPRQPCWIVEGTVEGVSFQYVNEDCENCDFFLLHQQAE